MKPVYKNQTENYSQDIACVSEFHVTQDLRLLLLPGISDNTYFEKGLEDQKYKHVNIS